MFALQEKSRDHVIGGCGVVLREKRYNFRHYSILLNLGKILESVK